jgi:hypothetical protein
VDATVVKVVGDVLDLIEEELRMSTEASSLSFVSASLLMLVRVDDEVRAPDFFFLKPGSFRRPLLIDDCFLLSYSGTSGMSGIEAERPEIRDDRVGGRYSLEAHDVGAVD